MSKLSLPAGGRSGLVMLILVTLGFALAQPGPQGEEELRRILLAVQRNAAAFETTLPDFVCRERLEQDVTAAGGRRVERRVIESALTGRQHKRAGRAGLVYEFEERREVLTRDGRPVTPPSKPAAPGSPGIPPPYLSGALSSILLSHFAAPSLADFEWRLDAPAQHAGRLCHVISFAPAANRHRQAYQYDGRGYESRRVGRAFIDAEAKQVARIEYRETNLPPVLSEWRSSVDYAPVAIEGEQFWLPATAMTELHDKQSGYTVRAVHHYSSYQRFTGSVKLDDK